MQGAGKTFNTGTEDWKWWASSSIIALAYYFWKREIFIFIWQATWDRQICWRAVLILPYFKPLRTGLLLSVFSVFHIFILMRYLRLSFLPVWANPCLSGPSYHVRISITYPTVQTAKKENLTLLSWLIILRCHSSLVPWQWTFKGKFQPLHLLQSPLEMLLLWTQPFLLYYFTITMLQQCSQPEGDLLRLACRFAGKSGKTLGF